MKDVHLLLHSPTWTEIRLAVEAKHVEETIVRVWLVVPEAVRVVLESVRIEFRWSSGEQQAIHRLSKHRNS